MQTLRNKLHIVSRKVVKLKFSLGKIPIRPIYNYIFFKKTIQHSLFPHIDQI